jgi:hypothetical protein
MPRFIIRGWHEGKARKENIPAPDELRAREIAIARGWGNVKIERMKGIHLGSFLTWVVAVMLIAVIFFALV